MSRVLIAYATGEGQTAKVASALALEMRRCGDDVRIVKLGNLGNPDDSGQSAGARRADGIIVAASVHAGKHQDSAVEFVKSHIGELTNKQSAFLSISLSAAADEAAGRARASEQLQSFLEDTGWSPDYSETIAGAFYFTRFSRLWQWIIRASQRLFSGELRNQGWPSMTVDREYTDWSALREFAHRFSDSIKPSGQ